MINNLKQPVTNDAWLNALQDVVLNGQKNYIRGRFCHEKINYHTVIPMRFPIVTLKQRKLHLPFLFKEAHNILTGDNRLSTISKQNKNIHKYSDDKIRLTGHYGPKIVDQIRYVKDVLKNDSFSRQAVINIWRENPRDSLDIPCTLSLQFLIRDNKINCISTMRSNDLWYGFPYDIFCFSMITAVVGAELIAENFDYFNCLELGDLFHNVGSMHLYNDDLDKYLNLVKNNYDLYPEYDPISLQNVYNNNCLFGSELIIDHLNWCSTGRYDNATTLPWFKELVLWS